MIKTVAISLVLLLTNAIADEREIKSLTLPSGQRIHVARGIQLGLSRQEIESKLGKPSHTISANEFIYVYSTELTGTVCGTATINSTYVFKLKKNKLQKFAIHKQTTC